MTRGISRDDGLTEVLPDGFSVHSGMDPVPQTSHKPPLAPSYQCIRCKRTRKAWVIRFPNRSSVTAAERLYWTYEDGKGVDPERDRQLLRKIAALLPLCQDCHELMTKGLYPGDPALRAWAKALGLRNVITR